MEMSETKNLHRRAYVADENEKWPDLLRALANDLDEHTEPRGLLALVCDRTYGAHLPVLIAFLDS